MAVKLPAAICKRRLIFHLDWFMHLYTFFVRTQTFNQFLMTNSVLLLVSFVDVLILPSTYNPKSLISASGNFLFLVIVFSCGKVLLVCSLNSV